MNPEDLVKALQESLGDRLKSVVLYGSAAAGDFVPGVSAYDVLLVIDPLTAAELNAMSAAIIDWTETGNPTPELFTPDELARSADVFPIELTDMQQSRQVMFGDDPLAGLKVDLAHYRTQLERELKIKLLLLRRKYLAASGEPEHVEQLLLASVSTFLVLLRAALRLYNDTVPAEKAQALHELAERLQLDLSPIGRVMEAKISGLPTEPETIQKIFAEYLAAIQQVVAAIDRHLHPAT
jgi:predicted nucleotidyltransferase